jgi:hypothetical protein
MATPTASGTAALLADYFYRRHGKRIGGLVLKNLLIHSARDLGRPGPDYTFGHGIVDGELGARVIKMAAFDDADQNSPAAPTGKGRDYDPGIRSMMIEGSLDNGRRHSYLFAVPDGSEELRATLVWHDPGRPMLVNDLDLVVKPFQTKAVKPFVLDPEDPTAIARTGRNSVDNVESVKVISPKSGLCKILVIGRKAPEGPQRYSLIVSAGDSNHRPVTRSKGRFRLDQVYTCIETQNYTESNTFTEGDTFFPLSIGFVRENADYGSHYGSISQTWTITNSAGEVILNLFKATNNYGASTPGEYFYGWMGTYEIPGGMPLGRYNIRNVITMHNGRSVSRSYEFTIY